MSIFGNPIVLFLGVLLIGIAILMIGPQGWRTYIKGAIVAAVPGAAEILNYAGSIDLSKFPLTTTQAAAVTAGIGVLIILFNRANKQLYGSTPK